MAGTAGGAGLPTRRRLGQPPHRPRADRLRSGTPGDDVPAARRHRALARATAARCPPAARCSTCTGSSAGTRYGYRQRRRRGTATCSSSAAGPRTASALEAPQGRARAGRPRPRRWPSAGSRPPAQPPVAVPLGRQAALVRRAAAHAGVAAAAAGPVAPPAIGDELDCECGSRPSPRPRRHRRPRRRCRGAPPSTT